MLTKVGLKWLAHCTRNVNFWRCAPYALEKAPGDNMIFVGSKTRQFCWYGNIAAHILYAAFLIFRGIQVHFYDKNANPQQKVYIEYSVGVYILPVLFQASVLIRTEEMVTFFNAQTKAFKQLQGKVLPKTNKNLTSNALP